MSTKANNNCFLVFSDDFGEHPSSCQHIFQHISKNHPVLWVNTIGLRTPKLTKRDFLKALSKIRNMMQGMLTQRKKESTTEEFRVCQPFMLPFLNISVIRTFNRKSVVYHVQKQLKSLQMNSPVMVITAPNACDYINHFHEKSVVYYCVDDFSEWPGLDKQLVKVMENDLIKKSDVFIATSQDLFNKIERQGKKVDLLTHGVDIAFFSAPQSNEHILLKTIPKPRVGYFGLFDDRSDKQLIIDIANLLPDISFVITGGIETDISDLQKANNVYFTGSIPYVELPQMSKGYDICMLPYKINKLTDSIQPLKFKEYLATGKPIISTPIKEALKLKDYMGIANTATEWVESIRFNLNGVSSSAHKKRTQFIKDESWSTKSEKFLQFIFNDTESTTKFPR